MNKLFRTRSSFLLTVIFIVATALMFFLMAVTYKHLERQSENSDWMTDSYEVSVKLERIYSNLKDIETERRNFILTDDPTSRQTVSAKMKEINTLLADLDTFFREHPGQRENMDSLKLMIRYKYDIVSESFDTHLSYNEMDALKESLMTGQRVMASINDKIEQMLQDEKHLLESRKAAFMFSQKSTPFYLYLISLFALGLLIFIFYKVNADIKNQRKLNYDLQVSLDTAQLAEKVGGYGIWILDYQSDSYYYSDNQYRLLGYEPQAFKADYGSFMTNVHRDDLQMVRTKYAEMVQNGNMAPFRYRIVREDGVVKYLHVVGKSVLSPNDEKILLGITMDVSSEIENQLQLEKVNAILTDRNINLNVANKTFEEAEKIGMFGTLQWILEDNRFVFSDNLVRLFGFEAEDFDHHPRSFLKTVHPQDIRMVEDRIAAIAELQHISPFTFRILRNTDKKLLYIDVTCKIIRDSELGDYFLFILQDATEEVLAKNDIEEKNRILEAKNTELQAFNYFASHDLQEPLRKIQTFISRLKDKEYDRLSDTGKQYLERIESSSGRMRLLIKDLLQFSRTTSAEQVFETADLNQLMYNALEELHHPIEEKKAVIKTESLPVLSMVPFQIQQLFINLISNSLKYSRENVTPEIKVTVGRVESGDEGLPVKAGNYFYKIVFSDNGIGFEQQYAEKIFTLFSRLHGKLEYEGTGIGLAICKKIAENHSGFIKADGTPGEGSVFTVYLPVQ